MVGNPQASRLRVTWFAKACIVFLGLGALGMAAGGVYLMVVQFTGTPARRRSRSASWTPTRGTRHLRLHGHMDTGGSLVGGNGHVVVGTVDGVDNTDVGKTIDVRLAGDEAYGAVISLASVSPRASASSRVQRRH